MRNLRGEVPEEDYQQGRIETVIVCMPAQSKYYFQLCPAYQKGLSQNSRYIQDMGIKLYEVANHILYINCILQQPPELFRKILLIFRIIMKQNIIQKMLLIHHMVIAAEYGRTGIKSFFHNLPEIFFQCQQDGVVHMAALVSPL